MHSGFQKSGFGTPIFMYHSISARPPARLGPFVVTPRRFEDHLRLFKDEGYSCLTVSQLVEARRQNNVPERSVCLTFDDGYADFYFEAAPILARHQFNATLYMVSGFVGGSSRWLDEIGAGMLPLMDWSQLSATQNAGIEIGAHSVTHRALDSLSSEEASAEISLSKKTLEAGLGTEIRSFAYPFGFYSQKVRDMLPACGFTSACAVRYATSPAADDPFALRRHIVRRDMSDASLLSILRSAPPSGRILFDRARSNLWSGIRHLHYRS